MNCNSSMLATSVGHFAYIVVMTTNEEHKLAARGLACMHSRVDIRYGSILCAYIYDIDIKLYKNGLSN